MGISEFNLVELLREPEYTGENRCLPCTVINLGIAIGLASVIAILSVAGGMITFFVCVIVIYLRGYLIPSTPTLTKRYVPNQLLRVFGKSSKPTRDDGENVDVEAILLEAGIVTECPDKNDFCLTESFETAW